MYSEKILPRNETPLPFGKLPEPILQTIRSPGEFQTPSQIARELMAREIRDILLISSPYNIYNMEEDGDLESRFINEYKGLYLGHPPRITGVSSATEALWLLKNKRFDMVLMAPHPAEHDAAALAREIKEIIPGVPLILLSPNARGLAPAIDYPDRDVFDRKFIWSGSPDLLLALVKNAEDHLNVDRDTQKANVRVLILVEDSPEYYSFFLPIIYKEVVSQTQALLDVGLNEKKKLLTMRSRPKILLARDYEEAMALYQKYRSYLLCVISDTRLPRQGEIDPTAGATFLTHIKTEIPELPLLLMSAESGNREIAREISTVFLDKNAHNLVQELHNFFLPHLGFGDFIFRTSDGIRVGRAPNLLELEAVLAKVPADSIQYHADRNHFSNWLMARSEIELALKFRSLKRTDFSSIEALRQYLITSIHTLRQSRQKGIVSQFDRHHFDADIREFVKIGQGSLGGKARGLAYMSVLFHRNEELRHKYRDIEVRTPKTLVICTDVFESFVIRNDLRHLAGPGHTDENITESFVNSRLPAWLLKKLETYLKQVTVPLSVRSSCQLEDTHCQPVKRLYQNHIIPNNHEKLSVRLNHLATAIKSLYAATYHGEPKAFYKNTSRQPFNNTMAVIIQELAGEQYGDYFYPAISGVAESHNYYPFAQMKPEEGVAHIALGFGPADGEGNRMLRFSPKYPGIVPQFSSVADTLKNSQHQFHALKMETGPDTVEFRPGTNLVTRDVGDAADEFPVKALASTYILAEDRIRDSSHVPGPKVMTFASLLKYKRHNIPGLLCDLLAIGEKGLGCPVEIDFSINLHPGTDRECEFFILQIRPVLATEDREGTAINDTDIRGALCHSTHALGNGAHRQMADIVYVKPESFKIDRTVTIAEEIKAINDHLVKAHRPYLLVGPGRWGTSDRWLGIPVKWRNISGAAAIIELRNAALNADPSSGSHFFDHITARGIHYLTVNEVAGKNSEAGKDRFDWAQITSCPALTETEYVRHIRLDRPLMLKMDGRKSQGVITKPK